MSMKPGIKYHDFVKKRDRLAKTEKAAEKATKEARAAHTDWIMNCPIKEEITGFSVFLEGLPPPWKQYEHSQFMMINGYSTVGYARQSGQWVWMIDSDHFGRHGHSSTDPNEVLAVLLGRKKERSK